MFNNCENLNTLDLNSFETLNVYNMEMMFNDCCNLLKLNLSSFNLKNECYYENIFKNCKKLSKIKMNEILSEKLKDEIPFQFNFFYNNYKLSKYYNN